MFDNLKNLAQLPQMLAKARELQEKMKSVQEDLAGRTLTCEAGGGLVRATVNGKLEVLSVRIDAERIARLYNNDDSSHHADTTDDGPRVAMSHADFQSLEDLIVAAVRAAQQSAAEMIRHEMARVASEAGLPPGMLPGQ
jgi:DNA-binding protein YbaB